MELMTDENNVKLVKERQVELNKAFHDFQMLHEAFRSVLRDEEEIRVINVLQPHRTTSAAVRREHRTLVHRNQDF